MKLITPQEARELSLSGYKIKCQLTREAETKFIEFLNYHAIPHDNLSIELFIKERQMSECLLKERGNNPKTFIFSNKENIRIFFEFTEDMFTYRVQS